MAEPLKIQPLAPEQRARVEASLEEVLASAAFRKSPQCQRFLRYVVEHSLSGNDDSLKERSIGSELFGREPSYDTAADPVVRVRATEVRKRLSQYYGDSPGPADVRIEIPQGSYRADFHLTLQPHADAAEPSTAAPRAVVARDRQASGSRLRGMWWVGGAVLLALSFLGFTILRPVAGSQDALSRFWAPVLNSQKPVLIYCGQPVVYFLSREVHDRYRDEVPPDKRRGSYVVPIGPDDAVRGRDIVPVTDQFVGIGNAHSAAMLTAMFATRNKPVEIRYANDLSFSDLRSSPSVLIGAFSNLWTMEMTSQLRFVFEQDKGARRIRDRVKSTTWQLQSMAPDGKTNEDYAIVTRQFDSATGQLLISAAGITQYGTRAAGEFLTDPDRMNETFAGAAPDWPKRNVQVLLRTDVYKGTPAPPKVVALHTW